MTKTIKEKIIVAKNSSNNENTNNYTQVRDSLGRSYATGKRKNAIAKVWIKQGTGKVVINDREI